MSFDALENWINSDYWDLDEGLRGHVATAESLGAPILESGEAMGAEEVCALQGTVFFTPPPSGYVHTDAGEVRSLN
uniref:Uncharacterized protein n=1 Tax=Timema tahoe TaxID=61484 RepID=A0A7R9P1U9_9NEOP|nr:unnamed protein product [Timema tahoe]